MTDEKPPARRAIDVPPVAGAALLDLDRVNAPPAASRASEAAPTAVATRRLIRVFIAFSLV
jgi:hypothetical protein